MIPTQKTKRLFFWVGLSLPMVALVAMTWLVHQAGGQFNNSFTWVLRNYKVLESIEVTQSHIVDAEANQRGYLMTGRQEYLEPYQAAMSALKDDLADLKKITLDDPEQQANVSQLESIVQADLVFDPTTAFSSGQFQTNTSVVTLTARGKEKIESMRRVLYQAREEQERLLTHHQQNAETDMVTSQIMAMVLIVAVAVALTFVVMILFRLERLQQFVTVCAWTGQVKHGGEWMRMDEYLHRRFGFSVTHGMSQEAASKMMQEMQKSHGTPPEPPR